MNAQVENWKQKEIVKLSKIIETSSINASTTVALQSAEKSFDLNWQPEIASITSPFGVKGELYQSRKDQYSAAQLILQRNGAITAITAEKNISSYNGKQIIVSLKDTTNKLIEDNNNGEVEDQEVITTICKFT